MERYEDKLEKALQVLKNPSRTDARGNAPIVYLVYQPEDVILVHDAIRPFITPEVITDAITKCKQKGSGLSAVRCQETIVRSQDGISGEEGISRQEILAA